MPHIPRQGFTPIDKRPSNSTWKQSILILCGIATSLLFHLDRERAFPVERGILEKLGF